MFVPFGSILIVYVPVAGNVVGRLMVPLQEKTDVKFVASGFTTVTVTHENVLLASLTVTACVAVPLKVMFAFWPGTDVLTGSAVPLIVTESVTSVTLYRVVVV